jgi:rhamnulokinase
VRLLKNIIGLWLVQECRRSWARQGQEYDYAALARWLPRRRPVRVTDQPSRSAFPQPEDMPAKIAEFCRETGQPVPSGPGATMRCILESLALLYRRTLCRSSSWSGRKIERLHIVGGGSKNDCLNQFTADALQMPVLAGPVEATAAGNVLIQAIALGHLPSLTAAREVVRGSMGMRTVQPDASAAQGWLKAYDRCSAGFK